MKRVSFVIVAITAVSVAAVADSADWLRFRGSQGLGTSSETNLPAEWSGDGGGKNVAWKAPLPGPGSSSPIVAGGRIYLTCYGGYALDKEDAGQMDKLIRQVVCLDRATGKILWTREFKPKLPESSYTDGNNNSWHGYSTSTPTVDEKHLYVFFGKSGVYCLDLADGREVWHADVGEKTTGWGSTNSLVLFENLLIVNASIESQSVRALDKATGKLVWTAEEVKGARNTPNLVTTEKGDVELVFSLPGDPDGRIVGLDPRTGKELWYCRGIPDGGYVCPSVIAEKGIVYAIGGRKNTAIAVRAGGRGDVTDSHILWRAGKGANVVSPALVDGRLYWVHERKGTLICLNAETGETVFENRIEPRPNVVYSSITAADGKIYAVSQHDGTFVFEAGPEFKLLAHNVLDDARSNACLAVDGGQMLLRNDAFIYCLGVR
ncbi:MAG: PQQ-binding-like beta-propeller repeat protein [Planctomycetaceae bacterium]|nr:PQQ-binding-like beta-propeller repeat protein [Planctomycetaceae bacterium]